MNSDNLGVGALTLANIELLRQAAREIERQPRFLIVGWRDKRPWYERPSDVEDHAIRLRHILSPGGALGRALAASDIVFDIGAGDSFTDIYGPKRFLTIWGTKVRALVAGKTLVLSPQTIGPFENQWTKRLAGIVLNRATAVVTRDALSSALLGEMKIRSEVLEATDVAMRLPYTKVQCMTSPKIKVGLNVSGLLMNGGYTGTNQFGLSVDYPTLIRDLLRWFLLQEGIELHLVGHVQSKTQPIEDDQRASELLIKEFPKAVLAPQFNSPSEAKSYIASMDFFMGARMHATIAAFSAGVPVVPMAYSRKFQGLFESLGYDFVADCKSMTDAAVMSMIQESFQNREVLKTRVEESLENVNKRLDGYTELAKRLLAECS